MWCWDVLLFPDCGRNGRAGRRALFGNVRRARLAPLAAALVLAGNLAQRKVQATGAVGLSTSSALFAVLLLVIIVLIGALSLLPAFALGPLAEQFMGAF